MSSGTARKSKPAKVTASLPTSLQPESDSQVAMQEEHSTRTRSLKVSNRKFKLRKGLSKTKKRKTLKLRKRKRTSNDKGPSPNKVTPGKNVSKPLKISSSEENSIQFENDKLDESELTQVGANEDVDAEDVDAEDDNTKDTTDVRTEKRFNPQEIHHVIAQSIQLDLNALQPGAVEFTKQTVADKSSQISYNRHLIQFWDFLGLLGREAEQFMLFRRVVRNSPTITPDSLMLYILYKSEIMKDENEG